MNRTGLIASLLALGGCVAHGPRPDDAAASRALDTARANLQPPLGATVYGLDRQRLLDQPGGENRSLAGSLAQLPGVTAGPGSQVRIRGR